ncbi:hypothetical protein C8035_v008196 [Colletotrichum spinosum]|uniref:Secreted protein n=1 Tax=Colletotrichum spinosum TaxID=1347390 RepID=A0A4V6QEJ3_9PEZI|nr:hypothetical protein C8035_v008196 [Colletotrichum spinosum]
MKFSVIVLLTPLVAAVCDTSQDQISLTFARTSWSDYVSHEVCPAAGSCVNMQSGPDGWAQKANWIILKDSACARFYDSYDCPTGGATWDPPCYDGDWATGVLSDWQNGRMKSYTVWHK